MAAALLAAGGASAAVASSCRAATARPAARGAATASARALCLVDAARAAAGLAPLRADRRLVRAATGQARDMVRRRYFAHQRVHGPSLRARLQAAGIGPASFGEAIAWGCGAPARAAAVVRSWLASPPHRAVLLSRTFTRAGVGFARRAPVACSPGATWVLDAAR